MLNKKFTALLLSTCLLFTACSGDKGIEDIQTDTSETLSKKASIGEAAPLSDPATDKLVFSDPAVGGNAILSQDTLGGYTARLELINIKSLPEDEDGAYMADEAHVRVIRPDGKEMILDHLYTMLNSSDGEGIWADCAENALKIYEVDDNGKKQYILMVREVYVKSRDIYKADFYNITAGIQDTAIHASVSMDKYHRLYWVNVSDQFAYKEGLTFTDSRLCYEMTLEFQNYERNYLEAVCTSTEGYSNEPVFAKPEIGGDAVFSEVTAGGYTARLELGEIITLPSEELNAYEAIGRVMIALTDENGNSAYNVLNVTALGGQYSGGIWADCTENAVKLYEIEWNGEKKYVLRCYISHGTENGAYPDDDPELYYARFFVCDFDAAEDGILRPYNMHANELGGCYISDLLVYKGGNVLYDEKTNKELTFDPDSYKADYIKLDNE